MISIRDQINAANRLEEIYNAYWAGDANQNDDSQTLHEIMLLLGVFIKGE